MISIQRLSSCVLHDAHFVSVQTSHEGAQFRSLDGFLEMMVRRGISSELSLMAFSGGHPVGILLSGIRRYGTKKVGFSEGLRVIPGYQRRGIGTMLVKALHGMCCDEYVDYVTATVPREYESEQLLYKKLGYRQYNEQAEHHTLERESRTSFEVVHMVRRMEEHYGAESFRRVSGGASPCFGTGGTGLFR